MERRRYLRHPENGRVLPWTQILADHGDMILCDADGNPVTDAESSKTPAVVRSVVSSSGLGNPEHREQLGRMLDDELRKSMADGLHRKLLRYDGVVGMLPEWVSDPDQRRFEWARNLLLNTYSHDQVIEIIDAWQIYVKEKIDIQRHMNKQLGNSGELEDSIISKVRQLDDSPFVQMPREFVQAIDYLVFVKQAIDAGPIEGIKMLAGDHAARGYTAYENCKRRAEKANKNKNRARKFCIESAEKLWGMEEAQGKPITRIGAVSDLLWQELKENGYWQPTSADKVREWLKDAHKKGELIIPEDAQKSGAPSK